MVSVARLSGHSLLTLFFLYAKHGEKNLAAKLSQVEFGRVATMPWRTKLNQTHRYSEKVSLTVSLF